MNKWVLLLVLAMLWAPSFLLIKIGLHDIPPLTLAALRLGLASLILYLALRLRGGTLPGGKDHWRRFAVMGLFSNALPFALLNIGELYADSAMASILNGSTPIFTAVLAHFFISDERLNGRRLAGVLVAFGGILLIFLPGLLGRLQGSSYLWGLAAFTVAAVSYGIALVYARKNLRGLPPLVAPTSQLITATAMLLPVALAAEWRGYHMPGLPSAAAVLSLAIFGTALAYFVYYKLLEKSSATFLSLVTYLLPPAGVALGIIFLDEKVGWNAIAGCALVILGVLIINDIRAKLAQWGSRRAPGAMPLGK